MKNRIKLITKAQNYVFKELKDKGYTIESNKIVNLFKEIFILDTISPHKTITKEFKIEYLLEFYKSKKKLKSKNSNMSVNYTPSKKIFAPLVNIDLTGTNTLNDYTYLKSKEFLLSNAWKDMRYRILTKYGATCQCCGRNYKEHKVVIHIDHIKPRSLFPELALDESNLQVLCEECNLGKSNVYDTDWR